MMDHMCRPRSPADPAVGAPPADDDVLMQLLRQISGGGAGFPGMAGMPPGMESMMSGMMGMGGMGGGAAEPAPEQKRKDRWSIWWTLAHALCAFFLATWALRMNPAVFDGTEMSRTESANLARNEKPVCY